ncbi:MAG: dihydropyrimidine dehydrogenase, partial [Desulfosalsimonas sp.]
MTEKQAKKKKTPRQPMPEQAAEERRRNFDEVPLGYGRQTAVTEAQRCMQCKKPACVSGCPVEIDIPGFVKQIAEGDFSGAVQTIWKRNSLPAICGRVCPQEIQCEGECILGKKDEPLAIGNLERFAADLARQEGSGELPEKEPSTGKKVAIVGSGPSGLTVAGDLLLKGHDVTLL